MASRGYSTFDLVAQELGRSPADLRSDLIDALIQDAEDIADRETGRRWLVTTVTNELHFLSGPIVQLNVRPVTAVTSVTARDLIIGSSPVTLDANVEYELIDPPNGTLLLAGLSTGEIDPIINVEDGPLPYLISVSYTAIAPVPGGIRRGVTMLVAYWVQKRLDPDRMGLKSYSIGSDLSVTMQDSPDVPAEILRLFRQHRTMALA